MSNTEPKIRINRRALNTQIAITQEKILKSKAQKYINDNIFEPAVEQMIEDFENHPVTIELNDGVLAENISNTLAGDFPNDEGKNLYSFIGFSENRPTDQIKKFLDPRNANGPKLKFKETNKEKLTYTFEIITPDLNVIYKNTPMPWASGLSWAKRIETGIPGLGRFLNKLGLKNSRSGGGIQIKNEIRTARFSPVPYLSAIFSNFKNRISKRSK